MADEQDEVLNGIHHQGKFDITASLWGYSDLFYGGFSLKQGLNEIEYVNSKQSDYLKRHYVVTAGTHFPLSHHVLLMTYINSIIVSNIQPTLEVSGVFIFNRKYWIGPNYRFDESIGVIAGTIVAHRFDLSYAYDFHVGDLNSYNRGSHELLLEYRLNTEDRIPCPENFW